MDGQESSRVGGIVAVFGVGGVDLGELLTPALLDGGPLLLAFDAQLELLFQGSDPTGRLMSLGAAPCLQEFFLVKRRPLHDKTTGTSGQATFHYGKTVHNNDGFMFSVLSVEVGWTVVIKVDSDGYAIESTDFRHRGLVTTVLRRASLPRRFCR